MLTLLQTSFAGEEEIDEDLDWAFSVEALFAESDKPDIEFLPAYRFSAGVIELGMITHCRTNWESKDADVEKVQELKAAIHKRLSKKCKMIEDKRFAETCKDGFSLPNIFERI